VVIFLLLVLSFFIVRSLLLALVMGAILAYVFHRIYLLFLSKLKNKTVTSLLLCFLVFLLLIIPGIFLIKTLVEESFVLYALTKQKLATGFFSNCENAFCQALRDFSKDPDINYKIQEIFKATTSTIIKQGTGFLIGIPRLFVNLFVVFASMFYFLKDGEKVEQHISHFLILKERKFNFITTRLKEIVHGVVYGYLLVALLQGALGAIGFLLFGISSPFFWGVVMAFLALIPAVGTAVIWVPASIFLLLDGIFQNSNFLIYKGAGLFIYGLAIVGSIDNILKPKLIGERAKVHPLVVILGILGGLIFLGPLGVIIGPLVLSLTLVVIEAYFHVEDN